MKTKTKIPHLILAGLFGTATALPAAIIISYTDQESDIKNLSYGSVVQAQNFGSTGAVTINGIAHANSNSAIDFTFQGDFANPDPGTFTGDMFTLLDGLAGAPAPTMTIAGLTIGAEYLFQAYWLVSDNNGTREMDITLEGDTLNDIAPNSFTNEFVLISYAFYATDDTFNGSFDGTGIDENGWLQGFSLQQVVPEPSSTALLGLGFSALLLRRRRS